MTSGQSSPVPRRSDTSRIVQPLIIAAVTLVCVAALYFVPFVRLAEHWLWDIRVTTVASGPADSAPGIVVVTITEQSLEQFPYRSPVDRAWLAQLITAIAGARPSAIGIDVLFDQPTEPAKDFALAQALAAAPVPVITAFAGIDEDLTTRQETFLRTFLPSGGASRSAWANLAKDRDDGIVRDIFPGKEIDGVWQPAFAPAMALLAGAHPPRRAVPYAMAPLTPERPLGARVFTAEDVKLLPPAWLAGKIVLVGFDLPLADRHRSPAIALHGAQAGTLPGVVLHAHALAHLLSGRDLAAPSMPWQIVVVAAMAAAGALAARISLPLPGRMAAMAAPLAVFWAGAFALSGQTGLILPVFMPTTAFIMAAGAVSAHLWRTTHRQKQFIEGAFARYVSPAIVAELTRNPDKLVLGGEAREVTYLFTDIAGFTTLTENLDPATLCQILNEYLDGMCRLFIEHQATIDKIVGDAVVGFFNAPLDQPDHARRGVTLALAIDDYAEAFRLRQNAAGIAMGVTRVGVHTGMATVGNFGGSQFFNYTGHGDTVNSASRLEGANKYTGTRLCVSAAAVEQCPGIAFRPMGILVLKGKKKGIETFEPVSPDFAATPLFTEYLAAYAAMKAEEADAPARFSALARLYPSDTLSCLHHRRLTSGAHGAVMELTEK